MATGHKFSGGGGSARTTASSPTPGGGLNAGTQALNPNAEQWSARMEYLLRSITRKDMPAADVVTISVADTGLQAVVQELQDIFELFDPEFATLAQSVALIRYDVSTLTYYGSSINSNTAAVSVDTGIIKSSLSSTNLKLDTLIAKIGTSTGDDFVALPLLPAATNLLSGRIVAINTGNQYIYADNTDAVNVYRVAGITATDVLSGTQFSPRREVLVTNLAWNWDPKVPVYLGLNGNLTQTVPATGNHLLKVGDAITDKIVFFSIADPQELL
jgi:hypothetical protein